MKNLEQRIAILEANHSVPLIDAFHELTCKLASEQDRTAPEKQNNLVNALEQLAEYLPD
ncbi:MAG: hypothetical protein ABTQ25_17035 [Nitrosomonas ureae]